jgi:hypothetical protein
MKINNCEQRSEEWYKLRAGSIGGTRFGQVISGRKNRLVYDLIDEILNGYAEMDDYVSDDMQFGTDNEPIARQLYIEQSGIQFDEVGLIQSEQSNIHHASPDGINLERGIVLEIKCTQSGPIHIQRFFEGPESVHMSQIINYFAVSDEIKSVHFVSYCPSRPERSLVVKIFTRDSVIGEGKKAQTIAEIVAEGRTEINRIESELIELKNQFIF